MSTVATSAAVPTRMFQERRFPLSLSRSIPSIRELYETAKAARWDPERDLDWATLAAATFPDPVRDAAREIWSRRAWVEYTGLSETPALLIRFCLEAGRESDPKLFLTVRNTEEAWHVECFHRLAERLGGYVDRPSDPAWEPVFDQALYRRALDADQSLDEYVSVHCAIEDGLEHALYEAYLGNATHPLVRSMLDKVVADKQRHAAFGWMYLDSRLGQLDADARTAIVARIGSWVHEVALQGYHVASLSTQIDTSALQRMDRLAGEAGLGAIDAKAEQQVFVDFFDRARRRLDEAGLKLPGFEHPLLGRF